MTYKLIPLANQVKKACINSDWVSDYLLTCCWIEQYDDNDNANCDTCSIKFKCWTSFQVRFKEMPQ